MRRGLALIASLVLGLLAAGPGEARDRPAPYDPWATDDSVGRNAVPAIAGGLAGMTDNWLDTMGNAWALTFERRREAYADPPPRRRPRHRHRR